MKPETSDEFAGRRRQAFAHFESAVLESNSELLSKVLAENQIDLSTPIPYMALGLPALFVAALKCDLAMVQELLRHGDSLLRCVNRMTAIQYAIYLQRPEAFAFMLSLMADSPQFDKKQVLRDVCRFREKEMFQALQRYNVPLLEPKLLGLGEDMPDFYLIEYERYQMLLILFLHDHCARFWRRLPVHLLRDIRAYT